MLRYSVSLVESWPTTTALRADIVSNTLRASALALTSSVCAWTASTCRFFRSATLRDSCLFCSFRKSHVAAKSSKLAVPRRTSSTPRGPVRYMLSARVFSDDWSASVFELMRPMRLLMSATLADSAL